MYLKYISINWTGQALTDEQLLVLRNVAAEHLRKKRKGAVINFRHALCEGQIERLKEGRFGTFAGTFFNADLGTVGGERWTAHFLLPRGSEYLILSESAVIMSTRPLAGGGFENRTIDHTAASLDITPTVH